MFQVALAMGPPGGSFLVGAALRCPGVVSGAFGPVSKTARRTLPCSYWGRLGLRLVERCPELVSLGVVSGAFGLVKINGS